MHDTGVIQINTQREDSTKKTFYDARGNITENEEKACAKTVKGKDILTYHIALSRRRCLFDPNNKDKNNSLNAKDGLGKKQFTLRDTNKRCFDLYLNYLKGRQQSLLILAQREMS